MKKERKNIISEHDVTKNMLAIMREFDEPQISGDNTNEAPSEAQDARPEDFESAKTTFMESVTNKVSFDGEGHGLKIYPKSKNAIFSGALLEMGGMQWRMVLNETDGLYVDAGGLQITDTALKTLHSLKGCYENWSDEWGLKMQTEYNSNDES